MEWFELLERKNLSAYCSGYIYQGSGTRADVKLIQVLGQKAAVKDYRERDFLFRFFLGRWLIDREFKIYQKLEGLKGVPQVYKKIDAYAFIYEYIEGKNCRSLMPGHLPKEAFDKLRQVVDRIHSRGVVHCDLKTNKNIILTPNNEIYLVDFTASFTKGNRFNLIRNWFFKQFFQDDLKAIAKLKREFAPHLLTQEEEAALSSMVFLERQARYGRDLVRRWIVGLMTRQTMRKEG